MRWVPLRNLRPEESRAYLRARGLPRGPPRRGAGLHPRAPPGPGPGRRRAVPGAAPRCPFRPQDRPDVVRTLLERFVQQVPGARHRAGPRGLRPRPGDHGGPPGGGARGGRRGAAPASCSPGCGGSRSSSRGRRGSSPTTWPGRCWRPTCAGATRRGTGSCTARVRGAVVRRLRATAGRAQQRAGVDLMYLHRGNRCRRLRLVDWGTLGAGYAESRRRRRTCRPSWTWSGATRGTQSARIAAYWLAPAAAGLRRLPRRREPAARLLRHRLPARARPRGRRRRPGGGRRPGAYARRAGAAAPGRGAAAPPLLRRPGRLPGRSAGAQHDGDHCSPCLWLTTPRLAWCFAVVAEPERGRTPSSRHPLPAGPGGRVRRSPGGRYGVFAHDWRVEPAPAWLEAMGQRELATDLSVAELEAHSAPPPLVVLSQPEFATAVRQALRDLHRPASLEANPLLRSRLVPAGSRPSPARPARSAAAGPAAGGGARACAGTPGRRSSTSAVRLTYLEPAGTPGAGRRAPGAALQHLPLPAGAGIKRLGPRLWQRELQACAPDSAPIRQRLGWSRSSRRPILPA